MSDKTFHISDGKTAYAKNHNAIGQAVPPSNCIVCNKPISLDISYFNVEIHDSRYQGNFFWFVGRTCSKKCADFYILREM